MTTDEMTEHLNRDTGAAPCCPWGSHPDDFHPAIIGLASLHAEQDGRAITAEDLDAAAGAIVNMGDIEAAELHAQYPDAIPEPELYPYPDEPCAGAGHEPGRACDECRPNHDWS